MYRTSLILDRSIRDFHSIPVDCFLSLWLIMSKIGRCDRRRCSCLLHGPTVMLLMNCYIRNKLCLNQVIFITSIHKVFSLLVVYCIFIITNVSNQCCIICKFYYRTRLIRASTVSCIQRKQKVHLCIIHLLSRRSTGGDRTPKR